VPGIGRLICHTHRGPRDRQYGAALRITSASTEHRYPGFKAPAEIKMMAYHYR
jgi:hypothetical protein